MALIESRTKSQADDDHVVGRRAEKDACTLDKRYARRVRNRKALIKAAVELFSKQGYDSTTTDQIAALAGVSPRTFFTHFATKDEILFDGYADRLNEASQQFRDAADMSLADALEQTADAVAASMSRQPEVFLARARMYDTVPSLRATMLAINEVWIDRMSAEVAERMGLDVHTDVRPRLAATLINGANRVAIQLWVARGGQEDLRAVFQESVPLVRSAIEQIEASIRRKSRTARAPRAG